MTDSVQKQEDQHNDDTERNNDIDESEQGTKALEDKIEGAGDGPEEEIELNGPPENTISLPEDIDMLKFIADVYDLSSPQGLGHTKFTPGPIPETEAAQLLGRFKEDSTLALSLDYVNGRACKMTVHRAEDGTLFINDSWFDHTKAEFSRLLQRSKIKGVQIERDKETEGKIQEQRDVNPSKTQPGDDDA